MLEIRNVPPSGSAAATAAEPISPPAPPRFSTKKIWPNFSPSSPANSRASVSEVPPGANGETMRTGFAGQSAAPSATALQSAIAAAVSVIAAVLMSTSSSASPRRSEFSPNQKMIDGDRAAAVYQEVESRHGPQQREFEAHLVPEKSANAPAFVVRHNKENADRAGSEAGE